MMKSWKLVALICVCVFLLVAAGIYFVLAEPPVHQRIAYYSDDSNYVMVNATVTYIQYSTDGDRLYLAFADMTATFQDSTFVIEGDNLRLLQENGLDEKVGIGTQVTFVSAERIFWDGYNMPVVALSVNGESLLAFEDGKANLLALLNE